MSADEKNARAIRPARAGDKARIVATLTAAFDRDPLFKWFVRDDGRRQEALGAVFSLLVSREERSGVRLDLVNDGEALAVWHEPGRSAGPQGLIAQLRLVRTFWGISGPARLTRALGLGQFMDRLHKGGEKAAYLQFLACHPAHQGKGHGAAVLRHGLAAYDAMGIATYAETANPVNLPFYRSHGFRIDPEQRPARDGPAVWPIWRDAENKELREPPSAP